MGHRPEFYDFDLFQAAPVSRDLDECPLAQVTCTVFDTETTGLDPSSGDEIIQIGATRIVNGKQTKVTLKLSDKIRQDDTILVPQRMF